MTGVLDCVEPLLRGELDPLMSSFLQSLHLRQNMHTIQNPFLLCSGSPGFLNSSDAAL